MSHMSWFLLRSVVAASPDADLKGLALGDAGALTVEDCIEAGRLLGVYPGEASSLVSAEVRWVNDTGAVVPGPGVVTVEPVKLNEFGLVRTFSVGLPTVGTGFEPLELTMGKSDGYFSVRLSDMTPPVGATVAQVWVWRTDGV